MTIRDDRGTRDDRFRAYYQKYYRRIVRFYVTAFRFTEVDAEDLAQEAFARFYEAMDEYRGDAEWAFFETVARNVAYNRIRSTKTLKRNAKTVDLDNPEVFRNEPQAAPVPDYAERQHAELQRKQMYDAIAELPAGQREALRLWLDGFKYDGIARALRISMDAVKSRIRDAKRVLRARLGDGVLPEDEE
jgi:RNA polymerase sigma factor (sigma-70 family)